MSDFRSRDNIDYETKIWENYKNIISPNNFTKEHTQNNVNKPPEAIMTLLNNMFNDSEKDLTNVLKTHFTPLMNNRIGTYLKRDVEVPYIRDMTTKPKNGEMLIDMVAADTYKWVMMVEDGNMPGQIKIAFKNDPEDNDIQFKYVLMDSLKQFSPSEKIEQTSSVLNNMSEDSLLETYVLSK